MALAAVTALKERAKAELTKIHDAVEQQKRELMASIGVKTDG